MHSLLLLREELSPRSGQLPVSVGQASGPGSAGSSTRGLPAGAGGGRGAFSSGGRTGEGAISFPAAAWLSLTSPCLLAGAAVTSYLPPAVHAMWPLHRLCRSTVTLSFRARKGTSLLSSLVRGSHVT